MADAPAPTTTTLISFKFFSCNSTAFSSAAPDMIAVPCWSSCITGISVSAEILLSISKHSGALISSRFIPPKVLEILTTVLMNSSGSSVSTSISKTSISANVFNNRPFPSITGLLAKGPMLPKPRTAVPLEITATKLALDVYK